MEEAAIDLEVSKCFELGQQIKPDRLSQQPKWNVRITITGQRTLKSLIGDVRSERNKRFKNICCLKASFCTLKGCC